MVLYGERSKVADSDTLEVGNRFASYLGILTNMLQEANIFLKALDLSIQLNLITGW